jgi:hypothetical protein
LTKRAIERSVRIVSCDQEISAGGGISDKADSGNQYLAVGLECGRVGNVVASLEIARYHAVAAEGRIKVTRRSRCVLSYEGESRGEKSQNREAAGKPKRIKKNEARIEKQPETFCLHVVKRAALRYFSQTDYRNGTVTCRGTG